MSKIVKKYKLLNFNAYLEAKLSLDNLHGTLLLIDHLNKTNKKEAVKMAKFYTENSEAFEASLAFDILVDKYLDEMRRGAREQLIEKLAEYQA